VIFSSAERRFAAVRPVRPPPAMIKLFSKSIGVPHEKKDGGRGRYALECLASNFRIVIYETAFDIKPFVRKCESIA